GSMGAEVVGVNPSPSRLDLAKAAARALVQFYGPYSPKVGVVWYNDAAAIVEPPVGTPLRSLVSATPTDPATQVQAAALAAQMVDSTDPGGPLPNPLGATAIGRALHTARSLFTAPDPVTHATPGLQAILLLTDGEE